MKQSSDKKKEPSLLSIKNFPALAVALLCGLGSIFFIFAGIESPSETSHPAITYLALVQILITLPTALIYGVFGSDFKVANLHNNLQEPLIFPILFMGVVNAIIAFFLCLFFVWITRRLKNKGSSPGFDTNRTKD